MTTDEQAKRIAELEAQLAKRDEEAKAAESEIEECRRFVVAGAAHPLVAQSIEESFNWSGPVVFLKMAANTIARQQEDIANRTAERDAALSQVAVLTDLFRMSKPTPLHDLLDELAIDNAHLLRTHDCDHHGWEGTERRGVVARETASRIRAALAFTQATADAWRASIRREVEAEVLKSAIAVVWDRRLDDEAIEFVDGLTPLGLCDALRALATRGTP